MGHLESAHAPTPPRQLPWWLSEFLDDAREWSRSRMWIPRALLLLYLVYADLRFFRDPDKGTIFSGITLAFHEMGHVLFSFASHFICSLMGSGMQVLIPIIVIVIFLRQPDYFGMSVGGFWLSFSLFELARYVGDARAMELPLVGFSDDPEHDWHYLLGTLHMLPLDHFFAFLIRVAATLAGAVSLVFAIWLLRQMARPPVASAAKSFTPLKEGLPLTTPHREANPGVWSSEDHPSAAALQWDEITGNDSDPYKRE